MPLCAMVTEHNEFDGNTDAPEILVIRDKYYVESIVLNKEEIDSLYLFLINNYSHILSHYWKDGFKPVKETT